MPQFPFWRRIPGMLAWLLISSVASADASEHRGLVRFNDLPVPGVSVTAVQGAQTFTAVSNPQGEYLFPDLGDGPWLMRIAMPGFQPMEQVIHVGPDSSEPVWTLTMLPFEAMNATILPPASQDVRSGFKPTAVSEVPEKSDAASQRGGIPKQSGSGVPSDTSGPFAGLTSGQLSARAADGFLVNGSVNNGAASPLALRPEFGNNRIARSLYNGSLNIRLNSSAFDARPFSLTGQDTPKPAYGRTQMAFNIGGPLPHLRLDGKSVHFVLGYQRMRDRKATVETGRMPTLEERNGNLSQVRDPLGRAIRILDPETLLPFENGEIPQARISPQARALLALFPLPNSPDEGRYNYQVPVMAAKHQDTLWGQIGVGLISGNFNYQTARSDNANIFGFLDTGSVSSLSIGAVYFRSLGALSSISLRYRFERNATRVTPYFAYRANISGASGISGNNQEPANWGPPNLVFSNYMRLTEAQGAYDRDQSGALSGEFRMSRKSHMLALGGEYRRQQLNVFSQQDARGTFHFTGAASGYDFADFLLGIPSASAIAFGNADKYLRASSYAAYLNDDWRIGSAFTLNAGVRWEYAAPFTELQGRLANLDVAPGFAAAAPILAGQRTGPLSGRSYPDSLIHPDKRGIQPRIGFAWRPWAGSSMVVRGGYGIYRETSVYVSMARKMAQQSPFSRNLSAGNTPANPLTLASGFHIPAGEIAPTFGIDPDFRVGYAQNWQLSLQRDLPYSLQVVADYMGARGSRLPQRFFPNTYPEGSSAGCAACPSGFLYITSQGTSIRHAGSLQLRRRLGHGFLANLQYTYAKTIDDAGLGGDRPAQNWLDLKAERARSDLDQRHLVNIHAQYTSGSGIFGARLLEGRTGLMLKEWTIAGDLAIGSGLPLTPVYAAVMPGTGNIGSLRPSLTGAAVENAPKGLHLNPAAYASPPRGAWGNAGRNSILGPGQFSLHASLSRAFRVKDRYSIECRLESNNILNHVTAASWNTTTNSALFGLPDQFHPMRKVQANLRVSF